ncbi:hypothetical protein [Bacillus sp. T33-2]|uniref:hypothetical protein n=1 Tax=Bacillus sp. T33-2 TaxID=2054168 RepID=UPI000C7888E6|nr:hypothetical protein [Bacillus sp. T33-2]PLR94480.1 hypothetical protein CVD19_17490 [Bacillus sp. T33-2]
MDSRKLEFIFLGGEGQEQNIQVTRFPYFSDALLLLTPHNQNPKIYQSFTVQHNGKYSMSCHNGTNEKQTQLNRGLHQLAIGILCRNEVSLEAAMRYLTCFILRDNQRTMFLTHRNHEKVKQEKEEYVISNRS